MLMPRLLTFTFCFLLFVAQLAPSLPFTDRRLPPDFSLLAHPRPMPGAPRPTPARRPTDFTDCPNLYFLFPVFASYCNFLLL